MKRLLTTLLLISALTTITAQTPAFPGAEGHGRYVTGGRGGKIVHVTNLNDSGTGSFRQAVSGSDKKIVVFDVGGVIALNSDVSIGANTTIMGQTAPSPGITLRYYTVSPAGNNIIMRYIRVRRGQERNVNDGADASWCRHLTGIIIDHCSFSWSIDEVASFYDNNNFTLQWSTIGESLVNAGHGKGAHGYGGIWGGKLASFHHNLLIHHGNRTPRFNGARYDWQGYTANLLYLQYQWENPVQAENVDFRNCVVYNCGNGCYGGPGGGQVNMVGNYYKTGPAASTTQLTTVTVGASGNSEGYPKYWGMTSRYYLEGNLIDDNEAGWAQMNYDSGTITRNGDRYSKDPSHYNGSDIDYLTSGTTDYVRIRLDEPAPAGMVTTHDAPTAYTQVLAYAGASLHPDEVDVRYVYETENAMALYNGSVTGKPGRIDLVSDVQGYTEANFGRGSRPNGFDTDKDGIADEWELANGLDPNDASDANAYSIDPAKWYTNIEVYCNQLVQHIMLRENEDASDAVRDYYPPYYNEWELLVKAINEDVAEEQEPTPESTVTATGTITWKLNTAKAETGEVSTELAPYITAAVVTVGSNLTMSGTRRGLMTDFKAKAKESGPAASNAITFSMTTADGYQFQPTKVAFYTERAGTDSGTEAVSWQGTENAVIENALEPARNAYTQYEKTLTNVVPTEGTCRLVINIYGLNADKATAVGNVVITGNLISSTQGINEQFAAHTASSTHYYTLQGIRLPNRPAKGIVIEVTTMPDGTQKSQKLSF